MDLAKLSDSPSTEAIYNYWEKQGQSEPPREYLGASIIGHECDRYLWYVFRQCVRERFSGRMYRLFDRGRREEERFIDELRGIGCEVVERDESGGQISVSAIGGHFRGHLDAMILGLPEAPKSWHVGEFKTHNDASFQKLKKSGVKDSKPMHHAQMQVYMGLTKVDRAFYLACDKDTDELYSERIHFDPSEFKRIMTRAERIIASVGPGERCAGRSDDWRCKKCAAQKLCWGCPESVCPLPSVNCRTCCHATPETSGNNGEWTCERRQPMMPGCKHHLIIPYLMCYQDFTANKDGTAITYTSPDGGKTFTNGEGGIASEHLTEMGLEQATCRVLKSALESFGGTVEHVFDVSLDLPLPDRYPPGDTRLLWEGPEKDIGSGIAETIGEDAVDDSKITGRFESEKIIAVEYGAKHLVAVYKGEGYAALWEGVE